MKTINPLRRLVFMGLVSLAFTSLGLTSCRRGTDLVIEKGPPLRFVLSGPGTLNHFKVSGPDLEREPNRQGDGERLTLLRVYWELAPKEGNSRSLDEIRFITYGQVPDGFVQVQPADGTPAPLVERDLYNVQIFVKDDLGINSFFAIREGKVVAEGDR